jgi:hypothetical protein
MLNPSAGSAAMITCRASSAADVFFANAPLALERSRTSIVGAPATYLRQLPASLAGINLQYGLTSQSRRAGQNP